MEVIIKSKMIVKRKCMNEDELKYWVDDVFKLASSEFGWDHFVFSGHVEDNYHVMVIIEKEI